MKTSIIILLTFVISINLFAQKIQQDKEKIWYGVDLSNAYLIGDYGFLHPEILNKEFKKLNFKVVNEINKYRLDQTFNQRNLLFDFTQIFNNFDKTNFSKNIKNKDIDSKITFADLQKIINGYNFSDKDKIGIIYIVEELNKIKESAVVDIVTFDTTTKKIISAKRYRGIASGMGIASHWANCIARINHKIRFNNRIAQN
ncbi:MAG: hypothetical protein DRI94_14180, partial [Bacteroidetes bacterium]